MGKVNGLAPEGVACGGVFVTRCRDMCPVAQHRGNRVRTSGCKGPVSGGLPPRDPARK